MLAVTTIGLDISERTCRMNIKYIPAFVPKDAGGVQPLDPPACDVVGGNQAIDVLG